MNQLALLLINGADEDAAMRAATNPRGRIALPRAKARAALDEALQRIALAAPFDREREMGLACLQLLNMIRKSLSRGDIKAAVAARHQLNRLRALYPESDTADGDKIEHDVAAAIAHLEPLNLAPAGTSIQELCRLAALRVMNLGKEPGK